MGPSQRARALSVRVAIASALAACGGAGQLPDAQSGVDALAGVDGSRFTWLEAECNDSPLDLARLGFEREVELAVRDGALHMTFDTEVIADACTSTSVWQVAPSSDPSLWRLQPEAIVTLPAGRTCGADETKPQNGSIVLRDDLLEIVHHRSDWCRGFDARFVYRRTPQRGLTPRALIARYVAAWNQRDANAIAELFVDGGSLVEPFTRTEDGSYARHEGRAALRTWYGAALTSVPWSALRLLAVEPGTGRGTGTGDGHFTAEWEYMDPLLSEPLRGRNLFVLAGGEIYEAELQLVGDPVAAGSAGLPAADTAAAEASAPAAAAKGAR